LKLKTCDYLLYFILPCRQNAKERIKINPSKKLPKRVRKMLSNVRKTVIITHGFRNNANEDWVKRMSNAFLEKVISHKFSFDAKYPASASIFRRMQTLLLWIGGKVLKL
jgi:hypothetical protein